MDRRTFIASLSAALALSGSKALAQRTSTSSKAVISEHFGAEVDFSGTDFELMHTKLNTEFGSDGRSVWEEVHLHTATGELMIELMTAGAIDTVQYAASQAEMALSIIPGSEILAEGSLANGGYLAFTSGQTPYYIEYQPVAFPDIDVVIIFKSEPATFQDELAQVQTMMFGGAAPFLFVADSQIESMTFGGSSTTSASTGSTRTTRGSRTSTDSTTSSQTTSGTTSSSDSEYVNTVSTHRETFLASYEKFQELLYGMEEASEADAENAWLVMVNISLEWQAYPAHAAALSAPAGFESLASAFNEWAEVVGEMGILFEEVFMGMDKVESFLAAVERMLALDLELEAALTSSTQRGNPEITAFSASLLTLHDAKATLRQRLLLWTQ